MAKEFNRATNLMLNQRSEITPQLIKELDEDPEDKEFKTERTQLLLRKSTKKTLKKIARLETNGSLNELINRICEDYIKSLGL